MKTDKLKIELDYHWKLLWNILWIVSIFAAFIITAIIKDILHFYTGLLIFSVIGLIVTVSLVPLAKRCDKILKELK